MLNSEIKTGSEELYIGVFGMNKTRGEERIVGQITIPLNRLNDQFKHEEWYDLFDPEKQYNNLKIFLTLQWFHSKVKNEKKINVFKFFIEDKIFIRLN